MLSDNQKKFHTELWKDLLHEDSYPNKRPLLAHYTSVSVLEQIIKNDEIWFSNPLYMNDLEELRFGMLEGAPIFRSDKRLQDACGTAEKYAQLIYHFDKLFNEFNERHALDIYITCWSEHEPTNNDGVLSMWRGYGANANGVAVVLDTSKFNPETETHIMLGEVHYASQEQRREWIREKIEVVANFILNEDDTDESLYFAAHQFISRLKLFSLFTKHAGFKEEKEWRFAYIHEFDVQKKLEHMIDYAISERGVEPKFKFRMAEHGYVFQEYVDRIILGPSISTFLAASSFRRLLEKNNKQELASKVVASTIPFRS